MKTSNKILLGLFIAILIGITAMMLFLKSNLQAGGISGNGNVKEKLMAYASSGSNIKYRGNPEVDKIDISNGANLEQAN